METKLAESGTNLACGWLGEMDPYPPANETGAGVGTLGNSLKLLNNAIGAPETSLSALLNIDLRQGLL